MDAGAYLALAAALEHTLPSVLEGVMEARERAAMAFEDLAAHAATGRLVSNVNQRPAGDWPYWYLWRRKPGVDHDFYDLDNGDHLVRQGAAETVDMDDEESMDFEDVGSEDGMEE
jgi:hypothetical protein